MNGDNVSSAVDQQESPRHVAWWIVGFVDGEGCFGISIVRNRTSRLGWQVQPEFSVTQGERSCESLEILRDYFGCGTVIRNVRHDNHRESMYRFSVRGRNDLVKIILPFFDAHPLRTAKREEFRRFTDVIDLMVRGEHLDPDGLVRIGRITETMNRRKPSRVVESSEAIRRPSLLDGRDEDMVHAPRRRGDDT